TYKEQQKKTCNMIRLKTLTWSYPFLICLTLPLTLGLDPILDKMEVKDGDRFSMTCDVNRIVDGVTRCMLMMLQLFYNKPLESAKLLTHYDGTPTKPNVPDGRNWTFEFTKSATNKLDETQVKLMVNDAKCSDAGFYTCECFGSSMEPFFTISELKRSPTCDLTTSKAVTSVAATKKPTNASVNLGSPKIFFLILLAVVVVEMKCHVNRGLPASRGVERLNSTEGGTCSE
ncbi:unnamed protein product, partial [Lymnaea stagnalis]